MDRRRNSISYPPVEELGGASTTVVLYSTTVVPAHIVPRVFFCSRSLLASCSLLHRWFYLHPYT